MAFEYVSPAAASWQSYGLRHILVSCNVLERQKTAFAAPEKMAARPAPQGARPASQAPGQNPAWNRGNYKAAQPAPKQTPPAPQAVQAPRPAAFRPLPLEKWPAIWKSQLDSSRKGLFGWTYWNLGVDLLAGKNGAPAQAQEAARARQFRSQVMGRILRELGHPSGTHTFWPPYLEMTDEGTPQPEFFWSGLKYLGCRGVIIFGSRAARALIPRQGLRPLQQLRINGFIVWIMRDLTTIEQDKEEYGKMLVQLKSTFNIFMPK